MPSIARVVVASLAGLLLTACDGRDAKYAGGQAGEFEDWQGRWVLVNYWAEWCAPCRHEIPELNALAREHRDEVLVVGVNFDGVQGQALDDLIARMGIEYPVLVTDPRTRWKYDLPSVLPTTVIIDPSGELTDVLVGPQTAASLLKALGISETT